MGEPDGHRGGRRPEQIPLPIGRGRAPTLEEYRTGRNPAPVGALRRLLGEVVAHRPLEPGGPGGDPRPGTGPPPEASSGPPSGVAPAGPEVRRDGRRGAERPRAPGTPLYLWGEEGVGKTHLLLAAVSEATRSGARALYVPFREGGGGQAAMLGGVEELDLLCLDDVEGACSDRASATALFHAWNRMQAARLASERGGGPGARVVVAARRPPSRLEGPLPDLISRLCACLVYRVHPMGDEELRELLVRAARSRGIAIGDEVLAYLMRRAPREPGALLSLLDDLDRLSLSVKRPVSLPLAREVLVRRARPGGGALRASSRPPGEGLPR